MKLIGLIGKKKSGKTTVANIISELLPRKLVPIIGFADALKDEVAVAIGRSREYIDLHKDNLRLILQGWGTDFRRKLTRDSYWIDKVEDEIAKYYTDADLVIIQDVRFANEAVMIQRHDGILVRINRDSIIEKDTHESETEMDFIHPDYTIENLDGIETLKLKTEILLMELKLL